jgi:uncharacterized RDD family membrane protein YckC
LSVTDSYIGEILSRLPVSAGDRARIEADLRAHFEASIGAGHTPEETVARMGPPEEVAADLMSTLTPAYAPLASRLGAAAFDLLLVFGLPALGAMSLVDTSMNGGGLLGSSEKAWRAMPLLALVAPVLPVSYFVLFEWLAKRTPGKLLFGLTVSGEADSTVSFGAALVRRLSLLLFPVFLLDSAIVLVSARRQRGTEMLARTLVLRTSGGGFPLLGWASTAAVFVAIALAMWRFWESTFGVVS